MKYAFIREHRKRYPVSRLCALLKVSRSGFHAWLTRPPCARAEADRKLTVAIRRVHVAHRGVYGSVKTWRTLKARGVACGKHRVARLRRAHRIEAKRRSRQRVSAQYRKTAPPAPDSLQGCVQAASPNRVWAGDMTFIRTREGWLHLAVLLDLYSRRVVGGAIDERPGLDLHVGALKMAFEQRCPPAGLIHHTDRGAFYSAGVYRQLLIDHGACASMNGRKVPQDNAVAESFFSNLKNELVHHYEFRTRDEARIAIFDYIEVFYNRQRIHQTLDYHTPEQVERLWWCA